MMQLEVGGKRYPIAAGETIIGASAGCAVALDGDGVQPRHAMLYGSPAGAAIRAATPEADILVNGVLLGGDPTPVLHGDKIQIGPHELLVVDPERVGQTRLFDARAFDQAVPTTAAGRSARGATGGRLVCLTDGREYAVGDHLVFGRDAGADVVVAGDEVSRHHAEIKRTVEGYVLTDASANGTRVNGARVDRMHLLARSDIISIGDDEFRFHEDPASPAVAASSSPLSPVSPSPIPTPPAGATYRLADTRYGLPADALRRATPAGAPAPLASLLVRTGEHKGRRLLVRAVVVTVGRGDYNDVVIPDPSVSAEHAKLRRREGLWFVTDAGSTNGTYVDGELVTDDTPLLPGASIRFGEITVLFEPYDTVADTVPAGGTRVMDRIDVPTPVPVSLPPLAPEPVLEPIRAFRPVVPESLTGSPTARPSIPESVTEPVPVSLAPASFADAAPAVPSSAAVFVPRIEPEPMPRRRVAPRAEPEAEAEPARGTMMWLILAVVAAAGAGIAAGFLILR